MYGILFELQAEPHTFSQELADSVQSFLRTPCPPGSFEYFKGALQTAVYTVFRLFCFSGI